MRKSRLQNKERSAINVSSAAPSLRPNRSQGKVFFDILGDALKEKGWQVQLMQMGKGGMISAKKDKLGMNFSFNAEDRKGTLAVFSAP